jgi:hypothetical protein
MPKPKAKTTPTDTKITIKPPNFQVFVTTLEGEHFVSNNFSQEVQHQIAAKQAEGGTARTSNRQRTPKDFDACYRGSMHISEEGWPGMNASAYRQALVRACCTLGVEMTKAKMCLFILPDGFERGTGTPLVKFTKGKPECFIAPVRNDGGKMDMRARARWPKWECKLRVRYNADLFTAATVANLIQHAGISVGTGAGRPFSKESCGQGWGTFQIKGTNPL